MPSPPLVTADPRAQGVPWRQSSGGARKSLWFSRAKCSACAGPGGGYPVLRPSRTERSAPAKHLTCGRIAGPRTHGTLRARSVRRTHRAASISPRYPPCAPPVLAAAQAAPALPFATAARARTLRSAAPPDTSFALEPSLLSARGDCVTERIPQHQPKHCHPLSAQARGPRMRQDDRAGICPTCPLRPQGGVCDHRNQTGQQQPAYRIRYPRPSQPAQPTFAPAREVRNMKMRHARNV